MVGRFLEEDIDPRFACVVTLDLADSALQHGGRALHGDVRNHLTRVARNVAPSDVIPLGGIPFQAFAIPVHRLLAAAVRLGDNTSAYREALHSGDRLRITRLLFLGALFGSLLRFNSVPACGVAVCDHASGPRAARQRERRRCG